MDGVARGEREKLRAAGDKQRFGTAQKCIDPLIHKRRERCIDLAVGAGRNDSDVPPKGGGCRPHSLTKASLMKGLSGLTSAAKRAAPGSNSCSSPSRLPASWTPMSLIPVALPPGRLSWQ